MIKMLSTFNSFKKQVSDNLGLLKHVELNLQLDIQQKIREIIHEMNPALDNKIAAAFEAAVKLDRVNEFNHVLLAYAKNPNDRQLAQYLDSCVQHDLNATDYKQAKQESLAMHDESSILFKKLKQQPESSMTAMKRLSSTASDSDQKNNWNDKDVIKVQEQRNTDVRNKFTKETNKSTTTHQLDRDESTVLPTGIKIF